MVSLPIQCHTSLASRVTQQGCVTLASHCDARDASDVRPTIAIALVLQSITLFRYKNHYTTW